MTSSVRELRREVSRVPQLFERQICNNCRSSLRQRQSPSSSGPQRHYASSSTASALPPTPPSAATSQPTPTPSALQNRNPYTLKAGLVLSRPPLITRDLTPFEKSFFLYQRRLNERLALPFPRYFYYPKGTPSDVDWKRKMRERKSAARDIGQYSAYGKDSWNDEVLVGAAESEPEFITEALLKDAVIEVEEQIEGGEGAADGDRVVKRRIEVERPMPRRTEADEVGDEGSLTRALQRTLYLVVKGSDGGWKFLEGGLEERESLKRAAERLLVQAGGINMNTWIVGNAPVGFIAQKFDAPKSEDGQELLGEKTFFMKGRIMAGQFNLKATKLDLRGYKWLAKDELEKILEPEYFKVVKNMLVEQ